MDSNFAGSSSDQNVEDSEEVFEMRDLLKTQDEMMEQVAAVLGAGDDFNCTYSQGYMKRQALYACLTCIPEAKMDHTKSAGVCLACSYHCHDGHNLVELYTKRNFRCDCGNKKFTDGVCNVQADKDDLNELNKYNQNFCGLYCTCSKPYPDPEDPIEDEMIQCIICEDWYHSRHLGAPVPVGYDEMVCSECVRKNDFLLYYEGLSMTRIIEADTSNNVVIDDGNLEANKELNGGGLPEDDVISGKVEENVAVSVVAEAAMAVCDGLRKTEDLSVQKINGESTENHNVTESDRPSDCTRPKFKSSSITSKFLEDVGWREKLCKCPKCMAEYEEKQVSFLLDTQDTVQCYEEKGKAKVKEMNEKSLENEAKLLNSMDRVPLMEALAGYNDFKEELTDYLKKFAANKKVIRVEDVNEFFTQLKARKRQKTEMQYYCR